MTDLLKGFAQDILSDADELLEVTKDFVVGALDYAQDRLLDLTQLLNRY